MLWNLKVEIGKRHGTQTTFAKVVGEPEPLVSRVIRGHENISEKKKKKWAKALNCKVADLFGE